MSVEKYFCSESVTNVSKEMISEIPYIREFSFNVDSSALIVVDMQSCFADERYSQVCVPNFDAIVPNINEMIRFFDLKSRPVIYTRHMDDFNDPKMMGVWWKELINSDISDKIARSKTSHIVDKTQYDAFFKTNMDALLKENNISSVVVTGIIVNLCVETTARSAFMHGYSVFMPVDATAGLNRKTHEASFLNLSHGFAYLCLTQDILRDRK